MRFRVSTLGAHNQKHHKYKKKTHWMHCIAQIKLKRNDEKKKVEGGKTIVLYV
jgi:hypothetical protein